LNEVLRTPGSLFTYHYRHCWSGLQPAFIQLYSGRKSNGQDHV
jgi:hypothetical protein